MSGYTVGNLSCRQTVLTTCVLDSGFVKVIFLGGKDKLILLVVVENHGQRPTVLHPLIF